jgi:hypothetical protein
MESPSARSVGDLAGPVVARTASRTSSRPLPPGRHRCRRSGRLGRRRCGPGVGGPAGVGARRPPSRERRRLGRNALGHRRLRRNVRRRSSRRPRRRMGAAAAGTATRFFAMYAHAQKTSRSRSIEVDRGASHLRKRPGESWRVRRSPTTVAPRLAPTTPPVEGTSTARKIRCTGSLTRGSESRCSSARVDGVCRPPPTVASPVVKLRLSFQ